MLTPCQQWSPRFCVHLSIWGSDCVTWCPQEKLSSDRGWESKGGSDTVMP